MPLGWIRSRDLLDLDYTSNGSASARLMRSSLGGRLIDEGVLVKLAEFGFSIYLVAEQHLTLRELEFFVEQQAGAEEEFFQQWKTIQSIRDEVWKTQLTQKLMIQFNKERAYILAKLIL